MKRSPLRRSKPMARGTSRLKRSWMRPHSRKQGIRVLPDGREICHGGAWEQRKREAYELAQHRCVCHGREITWEEARLNTHHKVRRCRRRDDRLENLEVRCAVGHDETHRKERSLHWRESC
jgi:hypothetical protein